MVSSDTYPPTRVDVAVLFGKELARRGHQIDWILQSEHRCERSYVTDWGSGKVWVGATDTGTSLISRIWKHVRGIRHDLKLFAILRHGSYRGVAVKDKFLSGLFAAVAAGMLRRRFVFWLSYPFPEEYLLRSKDGTERYAFLYGIRGRVFRYLLYRVLLPRADHIFVQSEQMLRDVATQGISAGKMTAVPMGVAIDRHASTPMDVGRRVIPPGERCFLYLGSLARLRRMDFLIRVLARVLEEVPDAKLYLVGRGNSPGDEQLLIDEALRLGVLPAVVFVGQLPQAQAFQYVRDADVCVSPFFPTPILNSTSPTKLVEYMAMGKAVVANDHPEQRLVIDESGAGYCVPYEEAAFARAVCRLLTSPDTARRMGELGWKYVARHRDYAVIADKVEAALLQVLAGGDR